MDRERDDFSGRYTEEYPLGTFLKSVERIGRASTTEIANEVGCSYDLAYRRLQELEEAEKVKGEIIGGSYNWWLPEKSK